MKTAGLAAKTCSETKKPRAPWAEGDPFCVQATFPQEGEPKGKTTRTSAPVGEVCVPPPEHILAGALWWEPKCTLSISFRSSQANRRVITM